MLCPNCGKYFNEEGFYYVLSVENLEFNPFAKRQLKYLSFSDAFKLKDKLKTYPWEDYVKCPICKKFISTRYNEIVRI